MSNQKDSAKETASEPLVLLPSADREIPPPPASETLAAHLARHLPRKTTLPPFLPAELTTLHAVALPKAPARQRKQLLTFAIEDRIGAPIDTVTVDELPRQSAPGMPLALVSDRTMIAALVAGHLPEILALARPANALSWHVWRDGDRVIVRASDGTGFAATSEALPALWARAGRPEVIAVAQALTDLPHSRTEAPPPDPAEIAFRLYPPAADPARRAWRPALVAACVVAVAMVLHLGIAAADAVALGRRSDAARLKAEAALSDVLPGVSVTRDTAPLLARLAPRQVRPAGSDLVPALSDVTAALASTGTEVSFRRLRWGDGRLVVLVLAPSLEDLQTVEEALDVAGFDVSAGAATAGDGGAEAEMTLERRAP